jgi:hypothetical protein
LWPWHIMCWVRTQGAGHHDHQYCILSQSDMSWWLKWTNTTTVAMLLLYWWIMLQLKPRRNAHRLSIALDLCMSPVAASCFVYNINPVPLKDQATSPNYFLSSYRSVVSPSFLDTVRLLIWFIKASNTLRSYKLSVFCLKHHVEAGHMLTAAKCGNVR